MTHYELQERLDTIACVLGGVAEDLRSLRDNPSIDEDYKLEWTENRAWTVELLDELDRLTSEISERWELARSDAADARLSSRLP